MLLLIQVTSLSIRWPPLPKLGFLFLVLLGHESSRVPPSIEAQPSSPAVRNFLSTNWEEQVVRTWGGLQS